MLYLYCVKVNVRKTQRHVYMQIKKIGEMMIMGNYVNPSVRKFQVSSKSKIYVDKSSLIAETNDVFDTEQRFICVSRPRRFGKTMAANMLAAYYRYGTDSSRLFENLAIANHPSYEEHLNKHDVIMVNMQEFMSNAKAEAKEEGKDLTVTAMLKMLKSTITEELEKEHPDVKYEDTEDFIRVMKETYHATDKPFVILIDEWDCLFREYKNDIDAQKDYLEFLRLWLKDQMYIGLAYMTGILPIKKYGTHSALNMFDEYSMTDPDPFIDYFGFTGEEVEQLSDRFGMVMEEVKEWYNGYFVELGSPIYNPKSVVSCMRRKRIGNYWNKTETFEALKEYIVFDFAGLQEKVAGLIAGARIPANPDKFANDMSTFNSIDDVFALLIHLGYLSYCRESRTVRIPNEEVKCEFINSIEDLEDWGTVVNAIRLSKNLLQAIWDMEADVVAEGIGKVHEQNTSILQYNNENSLSSVISLALYTANNYYTVIRELPSGKGYADLVFIPKQKHADKPAMVVELKWDETVEGAISQIKERNYISALDGYHGNLLLVGVNYEKESKIHQCIIETLDV